MCVYAGPALGPGTHGGGVCIRKVMLSHSSWMAWVLEQQLLTALGTWPKLAPFPSCRQAACRWRGPRPQGAAESSLGQERDACLSDLGEAL